MEKFEHGGNVYAHPGCLDFSASLNPLGMPQAAREALTRSVGAFEHYPDPHNTELTQALARYESVSASWVVPCAGATDALARLCAVVRPRKALVCAPCYEGYEQALLSSGARLVYHLLRAEDEFALTPLVLSVLDKDVDVVFVGNPNNPTGRCVEHDVLMMLLQRAQEVRALVVLDECFIDLTDLPSSNGLLASYPNLVIVKAFTKTFSLAGLRLGYALCANEGVVARLEAAGQPWAVSVPAQVAGVACATSMSHLAQSCELIARERVRLQDALASYGLHVVPGDANFLLFQGPCGLFEKCRERGVLIRPCENLKGLDATWYRVAVRTSEENTTLLRVLRECVL